MFIDPAPEGHATAKLAEYNQGVRDAWGFLPNFAAAFSTRPDVGMAWNALNTTVRDGMDRRLFEIATIAAARAMRSTYCTAAHSAFLRDACGDEVTLRAIVDQPDGSALDAADRAVYEFATKLATAAADIDQADIDRVRSVGGLSDSQIADVVFAVAARSFFTRVLDGFGVQLDVQIAATFSPDVLDSLVVGRPVADQRRRR